MRVIRMGIAGLLWASAVGGCGGKTAESGPDLGAADLPTREVPGRDRDASDPAPRGANAVAGTSSSESTPEPVGPSQGGAPGDVGTPGEPGDGGEASEFPPNSAYRLVPPDSTASVRFVPELGLLELAPIEDTVQSAYFTPTAESREFRRGVMEFEIPELTGRAILAAKLVLQSANGWSGAPFPAEAHRLYAYEGDGVVTPADYGATGVWLGSVMTDENDEVKPRLEVDITAHIEMFRGRRMTVRVQPDLPSDYAVHDSTAFHGAEFWLQELIIVDVWIPD